MTDESSPEFEEVFIEEFWTEPGAGARRIPPTKPERPSIPLLVRTGIDEGRALLTAQLELFKLKAKAAGTKLGIGVGLIAGALLLLLYFVWWIFHTAELGLAHAVPDWAASLIVLGILLILIVVFVLVGIQLAKKAVQEAPRGEGIPEDVKAAMVAVEEGKNQ